MSIYRANVAITGGEVLGPAVNTWHFRTDGIDDAGDAALPDLLTSLAAFYAAVKNEFCEGTNTHFDGVLTSVEEEDPRVIVIDPWTVNTTTAAQGLPPQDCLLMRWGTSRPTRSGRGRTFFGPMCTNSLFGHGIVHPSTATVFNDAAAALISSFSGPADGAICIYSRADHVARDIISHSVVPKFAVLRSRRD